MFGKKKNKEADSPNPAESKKKTKAKASSSKNRVTANRGPNFFAAHIEKVIMVIVAGLAGFLVYRNVSLPTLPDTQTPEQLAGEAQNLLNKVRNESHWEAIYAEREQFDRHKFHADTLEARHPADPTNYAIGRLEPSAVKEHYEQRTDPVLLPAEQIVVRNVSGTLGTWVLVNDRNRDPFLDIKDADPIGRKSDSSRNNRRGGGGNNRPDSEESPFGPGANTTPQRRTLKAKYDLGAQLGSTMGGMGGMGGMDSGGRGGDAGMGPGGFGMGDSGGEPGADTGMGPGRTDNDVGGILLGSGPQRSSTGELLSDQQRIRYRLGSTPVVFNSITALIPHRKNEEEYFRAFSRTGTFLSGRDIPVYLGIEVQRVEVTNNPGREIKEEEWKTILTNREIQDIPKKLRWATHLPDMRPKLIPDIIHTQYSLFGLTAPVVPLLVRDYREFSKHPKIEWRWNTRLPRPPKRPGSTGSDSDDESDVVFGQGGSGTGGMGGGPGGFGGEGFGGGGYGDEGRGDGGFGGPGGMGMDGGGFGGGGDFGGGDMMGGGYGDEGGRGDDFGFGGGGMGGPGGGGGFGAGGRTEASIALLPEYKMVRVYDFLRFEDVGRSFRYRMRIAMRDPNYPENQDYYGSKYAATALPPPSNDELSHEVYERVSTLRRQEDKMIAEAVEKKIYKARAMRYTPWSEPSPPVSVAAPVEAFAGDIDPKGVATLAVAELHRSPQFPGAVMAREMVAKRGSLLGVPQSNMDFISPTLKVVKQAEKYTLLTGAVLVDMRGGQPLSGHSDRDDPQRIEGEAMILRPDGSLIFTSDLDDQFLYRMYTFQDDKEAAKARQNSGDRGGGGFGEGGMDGGGGPGGEGR